MTRRFAEIDALKAFGIVAVILIHSIRSPWERTVSDLEIWIGNVTRFAVPAFLLASGFLYATAEPVRLDASLRRLRRVLVPYLVVSAAAQAWCRTQGIACSTGSLVRDLLFGASFGPYYYVFVIVCLVLVTPLFSRIPRKILIPVAGVLVAAQWFVDSARWLSLPMFWCLRNPLLWWGYFLVGWTLRLHYDAVCDWIAPRRAVLAALLALLVAALSAASNAGGPLLAVRSASWLNIYAILGLLFALFCAEERTPAVLRFASNGTYSIYLLHLFFVYAAQARFPPRAGQADFLPIAVPWAAGLIGSVALIALLQRLLGRRSRDLIGA